PRAIGQGRLRLHQIGIVRKERQGCDGKRELRYLPRIPVVVLKLPWMGNLEPGAAPRHLVAIDLLCHVSKECEAAVFWYGSGQGTEHHRRKVLTLVDHDMPVAPLALVVLELLQHSLRE